ncbi:MAG: Gfo/Idh/MocA family oxidoreductase [Candidatus Aminicenantes bacterium]|nr:Gfo/Idh/MocA family oxidoreductase [Candidatus Aminicenantes bacterium]NIO81331.1 Gfo/Idh/MocA family oxidoreductase [Candidatus Aminicenantes bacterium]NIQ67183.1 Gfo/Idh/MocA family oxidoreductase [Candidatus Aminicenantes bacterium]NIT23209.1 Gfo/Idh/MocA family oxidoreductase [Candidatus Aminicenantes bacterium]
MMSIKIGIIGASGYWGKKILPAILSFPNVEVVVCAGNSDSQKLSEAAAEVRLRFPRLIELLGFKPVIEHPSLDAVIVATPAETHFSIAGEALKAGKHVFLEKPMCLRLDQARELTKLAKRKNKILFIDHTYLHSKCLHFIKKKLDEGDLGTKIHYFHTNRTQMGIYRLHNILWDLGSHDLSIVKYLFPDEVLDGIKVDGWLNFQPYGDHTSGNFIDTISFRLSYRSGFIASAFLSWCYPKRARDIIIAGENRMVVFENNTKITIFEHDMSSRNSTGEIQWHLVEEYSPDDNPLRNSLRCFFSCVEKKKIKTNYWLSPDFACQIIGQLEKIEKAYNSKRSSMLT